MHVVDAALYLKKSVTIRTMIVMVKLMKVLPSPLTAALEHVPVRELRPVQPVNGLMIPVRPDHRQQKCVTIRTMIVMVRSMKV